MQVLPIPNFPLDALCSLNSERYPFLLESVNHNKSNRYSILFAHPQQSIVLNNLRDFDFLETLEQTVTKPLLQSDLPFSGGWFVYLSYEIIGQIEPILKPIMQQTELPIAVATEIPSAVIFDHNKQQTYLLDEFDNQQRIKQILADIQQLKALKQDTDIIAGVLTVEDEAKFLADVQKIHHYIKAGDVFQVNLSRQWQYQLSSNISSVGIYQALKKANPAPFSALAQFQNFSIICSSPERLFSVADEHIQTRPIAGTYPRGQGKAADTRLKKQLLNHPKERSEHIMLLDLERNDLGKVCEYGSVSVDEMMGLESYPYVHHIVSNIKGKLRQNIGIKHLIKALFPGGTITGCPKIRCMEIITELEQMQRAVYTGSLGYISNNGKMDFNILIRTILKQQQTLTFRTGGGIVFDSIAERELAETKHKAHGILKIFG